MNVIDSAIISIVLLSASYTNRVIKYSNPAVNNGKTDNPSAILYVSLPLFLENFNLITINTKIINILENNVI